MTSPIGGQPETLTTGLSVMIASTPTAPVGFGLEAWTEPQTAQAPTARIAVAFSADSRSTCSADLPPMVQ
jgi:hypothetical protein